MHTAVREAIREKTVFYSIPFIYDILEKEKQGQDQWLPEVCKGEYVKHGGFFSMVEYPMWRSNGGCVTLCICQTHRPLQQNEWSEWTNILKNHLGGWASLGYNADWQKNLAALK